jgi:hypothetical protein
LTKYSYPAEIRAKLTNKLGIPSYVSLQHFPTHSRMHVIIGKNSLGYDFYIDYDFDTPAQMKMIMKYIEKHYPELLL